MARRTKTGNRRVPRLAGGQTGATARRRGAAFDAGTPRRRRAALILLVAALGGTRRPRAAPAGLDDRLLRAGPSDHEIDPAFLKSMGKFPPTLYRDWAGQIELRENIPFIRQWDYEKQRILDRFTIKPSEESLDFRRTGSEPRHAILDLPLGEVHRSAFLRALAWAHHEHGLHRDHCVFFAATLCPLDFGLWQVRPVGRPDWWLAPVAVESPMDVAPAAIWSKLEADLVPIDQGVLREWTLTQAQGPIRVGVATYDLSVWGIFQRCVGPESPEPEVLADWCASLEPLPWKGPSMHSMEGQVSARPPDDGTQQFADWQVAPTAFPIHARKLLRWQWWQLSRPAWLPSPLLCRDAVHFRHTAAGLEATSGARPIGRGTTWTDGLAETLDPPVPPASGQALHTRRDVLMKYARDGNWTFCWVCRLTAYLRDEKYEPYREVHFHRVIGASAVLKP